MITKDITIQLPLRIVIMLEKKNSISSLFPAGMVAGSIDYGIPLPFPEKMLSNYSDFKSKQPLEEEDWRQGDKEVTYIENEDAEALEQMLNLKDKNSLVKEFSDNKSFKHPSSIPESPLKVVREERLQKVDLLPEHSNYHYEDTKNLLRNFGNAQNQFILYNERAHKIVEDNLSEPQKFNNWVRSLKLQNFEQFKKVWGGDSGTKLFTRLYRELCWKFYVEEAVSYVLMSRMKNEVTKMTHLKYIHRFLEGIKDPADFRYFRKQ